jgi:hypothetical protein
MAASPRGSGAGLCDSCRHQRLVRNTRGSAFSLCERSREDERYPRYPRTPVLSCPGFEQVGESDRPPRPDPGPRR